jgi:hypothetical protein
MRPRNKKKRKAAKGKYWPKVKKQILESVKPRFPRTEDPVVDFVAAMRIQYPAPFYNPRTDGSWNPADLIIDWLMSQKRIELRRLCRKHALREGSRSGMVKRMYLHWRHAKLRKGFPYIGYDTGFLNTREPNCICGAVKAVGQWTPQRFPRLPFYFPRLKVSSDGRIRFPRPE